MDQQFQIFHFVMTLTPRFNSFIFQYKAVIIWLSEGSGHHPTRYGQTDQKQNITECEQDALLIHVFVDLRDICRSKFVHSHTLEHSVASVHVYVTDITVEEEHICRYKTIRVSHGEGISIAACETAVTPVR